MRLIYSYIHKFRNIIDQEVRFTPEYDVRFANGELSIAQRRKDDASDYLYGDNLIKYLSIIVGRTGSGKTNFLQMIGMDIYDRLDSLRKNHDSYFLLYQTDRPFHFIVECVGITINGLPISHRILISDNISMW